jgi:hypothetical protein
MCRENRGRNPPIPGVRRYCQSVGAYRWITRLSSVNAAGYGVDYPMRLIGYDTRPECGRCGSGETSRR